MQHKPDYAFSLIGKQGGKKVVADMTSKHPCPKCGANIINAEIFKTKKKIKICLVANGFVDHSENCWTSPKYPR